MMACSRSVLHRNHSSPVAIALLGLLLVFLSSVTCQQAAAAQVGHGFTGPLDHLVVASHHETLRVSAEKPGTDSDGPAGPDLPGDLLAHLVEILTPTANGAFDTPAPVYAARPARFLTPQLRAPPSM